MRWLSFVNIILVVCIGFTVVGIVFTLSKSTPTIEALPAGIEKQIPKRPFEAAKLATLHQGPLALKWVEPSLELPNLAKILRYHGLILRPDVLGGAPRFYCSFINSEKLFAVQSAKPIYLSYCQTDLPTDASCDLIWGALEVDASYAVSDTPTSLWLEMVPCHGGKCLDVTVHMKDEKEQEIVSPSNHRSFTLSYSEPQKSTHTTWEIDDLRVDSTLLIRQKTRWAGTDKFLIQHGGTEYQYTDERERIDFESGSDHLYSCFVKAGDCLVWQDGRWKEIYLSDKQTLGLPLLAVKKIEDKVMSFELWDKDGISKIPLNLIKTRDVAGMPNLEEEFRFVGAKTWAQFIIESHSHRMTLRPYDWLVLTSDGWVKLDSTEKIDDYVTQKLVGPLLVLDKLSKQNSKQVLTGHLYNTTRSDVIAIELPTAINTYTPKPSMPVVSSVHPITHGGVE